MRLPSDYSNPVEIGRGAFGVVYRVRQESVGRWIVLKSLPASARKEAEAEARHMASIGCAALPSIYSVTVHKGRVFVAEEWLQGPSLQSLLELGTLEDVPSELCAGICEALGSLHEAGLSHGDFKPANILCTVDGKVRLVDLGFAHKSGTRTRIAAGTPAYLAPECEAGGQTDPRASDLWSLGIVLHELLCGVRPSATDIQRGLPRVEQAGLPSGWAGILRELLATEPSLRPSARDTSARIRKLHPQQSPQVQLLCRRLFAQQMALHLHKAASLALQERKPEQAFSLLSEALEFDPDHAPSIELLPSIRFQPEARWRLGIAMGIALLVLLGLGTVLLSRRAKTPETAMRLATVEDESTGRIESAPVPHHAGDTDLPMREDSRDAESPRTEVDFEGFPAGSRVEAGALRDTLDGSPSRKLFLPVGRQRIDVVYHGKALHSGLHELVEFQTLVLRPDRAGKDSP